MECLNPFNKTERTQKVFMGSCSWTATGFCLVTTLVNVHIWLMQIRASRAVERKGQGEREEVGVGRWRPPWEGVGKRQGQRLG